MLILPGVKPWVQSAAAEVADRFHPISTLGIGLRADNPTSDHPRGLAVDWIVGGDRAKGDAIATYVVANAARLGITYVIWYARIWTPGEGWRAYSHPSGGTSPTQLHMDHVHASFRASFAAGGSAPIDTQGFGGIPDPLSSIAPGVGKAVGFLISPHTYLRAAMLIGGIILLIIGLFTIDRVKTSARSIANVVT